MSRPVTDHTIAASWMRPDVLSWIKCNCGALVEAMPDRQFPDPHEPLTREWLAHRKSVGAPSKANSRGAYERGSGYQWGRAVVAG